MSKNLVKDFFDKSTQYEIAVFSTFGLNLNFLENYLLKLNGMESCESINIFTDSSVYEGFSSDIHNYYPRWLNKKYMVTGIKSKHIFHPKVYLMASDRKAQIAISSANLTREGITSNLEMMSIFSITEKDTRYSNILRDTVNFFGKLAEKSKSKIARDRIKELEAIVARLTLDSGSDDVQFIHNLDEPLLAQMEGVLSRVEVKNIKVISPFYDKDLNVLSRLREQYPDATIQIYIQQDKSNFPIRAYQEGWEGVELHLYRGIERYIHGKAIVFQSDDNDYLFTGSANFTESALIRDGNVGNIEAGLFGVIDSDSVEEIFSPLGVQAEKIEDIDMINTTHEPEEGFKQEDRCIHYLLEAKEEDKSILLTVDDEVDKNVFTPEKLILYGADGNAQINFTTRIKPKSSIKDIHAVQVVGASDSGQTLLSNTVWILRLEDKEEYKSHTRYKRILNNPYELEVILNDIMLNGDTKELVNFLKTFDIPLDLMFSPANVERFIERRTKGNVMGDFIESKYNVFAIGNIYDLFNQFLDNLYSKMCNHYKNVQLQRLPNFMLIYATLFSMIRFIDDNIYGAYIKSTRKIVKAKKWADIRKYYDMLLCYIEKTLGLIWMGKGEYISFDEKVTQAISNSQETLGDVKTFSEYIKRDYLAMYNEAIDIGLDVIDHFKEMNSNIKVRTVMNTIVAPIVSQNDVYINDIDEISGLLAQSSI